MQQLLALLLFVVFFTSSFATATYNHASCLLSRSDNQNVVGRVDLREQTVGSATLEIHLQVSGSKLSLEANSIHGFHVHTYGNISGGCGTTGGHYNPGRVNHAAKTSSIRHVGDLGNVVADSAGNIDVTFTDTVASLVGDQAIIGRAFVLHAGRDDLGNGGNAGSLASGNAGARLACCVIGWANGAGWN